MRTFGQGHKGRYVADIVSNENIDGVFVVTQAQQFQAKNGPFWRLTLQDATGQIEGKVWSPLAQDFSEFSTSAFYAVSGKSTTYKDKVELSIASITPLPDEAVTGLSLGDFVAVSPYRVEDMLAELQALWRAHITHPPLLRFLELLFEDKPFLSKFSEAPAAKAMHHAYAGGLLEHTLSICRLCMSIADNYPHIDRQILLTGALCHDLGKIWELTSGLTIDYTDEGRLVGHISLGLERITPFMQKAGLEPEHILHVQHLILSHHGTYEFGAPRLPATAEAFILHFADNIDAKMQQVAQALDGDKGEGHWSNFVRGLDRQVYQASPVGSFGHRESHDLSSPEQDGAYGQSKPYEPSLPYGENDSSEKNAPWKQTDAHDELKAGFRASHVTDRSDTHFPSANHSSSQGNASPQAIEEPVANNLRTESGSVDFADSEQPYNDEGMRKADFFEAEPLELNEVEASFSDTEYLDALLKDSSDMYLPSDSFVEGSVLTSEVTEENATGNNVQNLSDVHIPPVTPIEFEEEETEEANYSARAVHDADNSPGEPLEPSQLFEQREIFTQSNSEESLVVVSSLDMEGGQSEEPDVFEDASEAATNDLPESMASEEDSLTDDLIKNFPEEKKTKKKKTQSDSGEDEVAHVGLAKKAKASSVSKQSSLPLLEQCSLLSKE